MSDPSSKRDPGSALLEALLASMDKIVFVLSAQGRVEQVSVGARQLLDLDTAQLRERSWSALCHPPEDASALLQGMGPEEEPAYFRTELLDRQGRGHPAVLSLQALAASEPERRQYLVVGYSLEHPPGERRWEDASQLSSRVSQLQESLAMVNRRMSEMALQLAEERQKMRAVMASLGEGMLVLDTGQRVVQVGGIAEQLLGRPGSELVGQRFAEVLPGLFQSLGQLMAQAEDPLPEVLSELTKDIRFAHDDKTFRANLAPIVDSEKRCLGSVVIFEDFTHIAEVDRMKSELISIVSHELRTPLSSVQGYIDLLLQEEEADPDTRQEYLKIVQANAARLVEMLDVMLDIERIESGRLQLGCETLDVAYIFQYVRSTFAQIAEEKQIELVLEGQEGVAVRGDMDRIIQVLSNLVSNAIKYSPEGGRVTLRAREDAEQVALEVADVGVGIPAPEQQRLFEKFYRASGSQQVRGTGLGLSIAKSLVEAHGGTLSVTSAPGEGSTFTVVLPKSG